MVAKLRLQFLSICYCSTISSAYLNLQNSKHDGVTNGGYNRLSKQHQYDRACLLIRRRGVRCSASFQLPDVSHLVVGRVGRPTKPILPSSTPVYNPSNYQKWRCRHEVTPTLTQCTAAVMYWWWVLLYVSSEPSSLHHNTLLLKSNR